MVERGFDIVWVPPALFEGYRILKPLGEGGMGSVYLAQDVLLERRVAIKFIAAGGTSGKRRLRFVLEGQALARLSHPNVVLTYRVGEVEQQPFLVSEFIEGQSLDRRPGPAPWREVVEIGIGLCQGLAAAHRAGVLHRDIKPANVMVTLTSQVKLIDFGLAKLDSGDDLGDATGADAIAIANAARSDRTITLAEPGNESASADVDGRGAALSRAGAIIGTPRYLAPERLRGQAATRRSDLYGVGCVMHELCWGALPGEKFEVPPGSVDPRLAAIIRRCLDPEPVARFASAEALLDALTALQEEVRELGPMPDGNPYPGLCSFERAQRGLFLGRATETRAVLERLKAEPLVVVAGDSGVGKSSLCRAGVLPLVAEGALLAGTVEVLSLTPTARPLLELARAFGELLAVPLEQLLRWLRDEPLELIRELAAKNRRVLLFVDQAEELLTQAPQAEAQQVARALASWATASGAGLRVLCTVRADFLAGLAGLPELGAHVAASLFLLRPLTPDRLREIIVAPARRTGVRFEAEQTVDELVASALSSEAALPLLQFTLCELWKLRDPASNVISRSTLAELGGVAGALERYADGLLRPLSKGELAAVRVVLSGLVTPHATRARLSTTDLEGFEPSLRAALEFLIRGRLVVAVGSAQGVSYELAHDALIGSWSTLTGWLEAEALTRRTLARLREAADEWARGGRRPRGLWDARQLAEVRATPVVSARALEAEFLAASEREVRRARVLRALAVIGLAGLLGGAFAAAKLRAKLELDAASERSLGRAHAQLGEARRHDAETRSLRKNALEAFDQAVEGTIPWGTAEASWEQVQHERREADSAYGRGTTALEAALLLNAGDGALRAEMVAALLGRGELAELFHEEQLGAELRERAASLEGPLAATASATLSLVTVPSDARRVLERWVPGSATWQPRELPPSGAPIEPGSYRVKLEAQGHASVLRPFVVRGAEATRVVVTLPSSQAVPPGLVWVEAEESLSGSDDDAFRGPFEAAPLHPVRVPPFLIGRHEVTFEEYLRWVDTVPPSKRRAATPSDDRLKLEPAADGEWTLTFTPVEQPYRARWGEPLVYPGRDRNARQDWRHFPVVSVSRDDASRYLAWLDETGAVRGARLCTALEWERAARGVDGRRHTTGAALRADDANIDVTYGRKPDAFGPDEVGLHAASDSPFGVADLEGNALEIVTSHRQGEQVSAVGGAWYYERVSARLDNRFPIVATTRSIYLGFRVCASPVDP